MWTLVVLLMVPGDGPKGTDAGRFERPSISMKQCLADARRISANPIGTIPELLLKGELITVKCEYAGKPTS
jgi:hypothetical protein